MQSVRLHMAGDGEVWTLSKCRRCGEIDKHTLRSAATGTVVCRKCGHGMDMTGATVEAVDAEVAKATGSRILPGLRDGQDPPAAHEALRSTLAEEGLAGAVRVINRAVPHRYTGIFLKAGPLLRNVALHDKLREPALLWEPFPLGQSFCSLVLGSGEPLAVSHAHADRRAAVKTHPAGGRVQAYCGVPLIDAEGAVLGTLCHFDEREVDADIDLVAMLQIPALLRDYLPPPQT
jgi:GAF domain-containing protein